MRALIVGVRILLSVFEVLAVTVVLILSFVGGSTEQQILYVAYACFFNLLDRDLKEVNK